MHTRVFSAPLTGAGGSVSIRCNTLRYDAFSQGSLLLFVVVGGADRCATVDVSGGSGSSVSGGGGGGTVALSVNAFANHANATNGTMTLALAKQVMADFNVLAEGGFTSSMVSVLSALAARLNAARRIPFATAAWAPCFSARIR